MLYTYTVYCINCIFFTVYTINSNYKFKILVYKILVYIQIKISVLVNLLQIE